MESAFLKNSICADLIEIKVILRPKKSEITQRHQIAQAMDNDNPYKGKPIYIHSPSFKIGLDEYIKAMDGPPAWVMRLKRIEDWMDQTSTKVREEWFETALENAGNTGYFRREWIHYVENFDFSRVNKWISDHNEYFPIEANLPYDIRTGKIFYCGKPFTKKDFLGQTWLLDQFPPNLEQALNNRETPGIQIEDGNARI